MVQPISSNNPVTSYTYPQRLATFPVPDWPPSVCRQLAALGHVAERPPLEILEHGSRCVTCSNFVRKDLSIRALGDGPSRDFHDDFRGFAFHLPDCPRLQVRIPLEPQALLGGLYLRGGRGMEGLRARFERKDLQQRDATIHDERQTQTQTHITPATTPGGILFALPTELRLQIYTLILPHLGAVTEILTLNRDSARVITLAGYTKIGPRDTTKPNILRTCRAVHREASDLLYHSTTFSFTSKTMYIFLRNIGASGRSHLRNVDVHCGSREDAMAFALLASCEKLTCITIRLPRPKILLPRSPLWLEEGMACLLSLRGLKEVRFGFCESSFGCMDDGRPDAEVIRREITLPHGAEGGVRCVDGFLDV